MRAICRILMIAACLLMADLPVWSQVARSKQNKQLITVAQDGSGDYTTVQAALDAIPSKNKKPVTVFIKTGVYKEKILLDSLKHHVTLIGEDKYTTILTYDDHTGKLAPGGDTINTRTSWSTKILADDFTAMNISFDNNAGFNAGQAVALESDGDRAIFYNCRFLGFQDVLFTNNENSRQYFKDCYIDGTTDFVFGNATAWFEHCQIHSKKNSHVTAAATPPTKTYGYIFNDCVLTGDTSVHNASLGRPWRPYAAVVYLHCYIGPHIRPEGWSNWNNTDNYKTTRFGEYQNFGPGADLSKRLSWVKQLKKEEAMLYKPGAVFGNWDPEQALKTTKWQNQ